MRAKPEPQEWYFFKAGSHAGMKAGPLSWERLCEQARAGTLEPADVVWDPGSGWRTAAKVPGLFPEADFTEMADASPDTLPTDPPTGARGRSWVPWVASLVALVIVAGGLGAYFGFVRNSGNATASDQTTTTAAAATTTVPVSVTQSTSTSQSTTTTQSTTTSVTGVTTVDDSSLLSLGESDNGHEVELHVGDHVRIELEPEVAKRIRLVSWAFEPIVVRETDSGLEVVDDTVVEAWLEVEAVVAGPVTIRACYEYRSGSVKIPWVCYLIVSDR